MNPTSWSFEDGHLLQSLRLKAGVDAHVFARNNTISLAQLQELESGEGQSFYNEQIKRNTGVKLLKKLGFELPLPAPQAPPPVTEVVPAELVQKTDSVSSPVGSTDVRKRPFSNPILRLPLVLTVGLLTLGLLGFWGSQRQDPAPTEQRPVVHQIENTPPSSSAAVTPSSALEPATALPSASATATQGNASSLNPLPVSEAPAPDSTRLASVACEEQHRHNSLSHTPKNPLKPGNYIYIEARKDSQLCVLDTHNKMSVLMLKAGTHQKVSGEAPFLLHASNWQGLQVFFQGRPVRIEHEGNAHLTLNSLPL